MSKFVNSVLCLALTATAPTAAAAPMAYSINSDSPTGNADSLYRIDLATGAESRIAMVKSLGQTRIDVEGLAIAPDGTLWGVDDDSLTLFPINPANAVVQTESEVPIKNIPTRGGNDFGMTFACDGTLYVTSVAENKLYSLDLAGNATEIGTLGQRISAIASYGAGPDFRLYGLGNGLDVNLQTDSPNLYAIDPASGAATEIGALVNAAPYSEGGLAFDDNGQLWAITDRRALEQPSEILNIDPVSGAATVVATTSEFGFESLAVTVPRGCDPQAGGESARFVVQKQYLDGNDVTPVTLNIQCNTGLPLTQSKTVIPNAGPFGAFEVEFTVTSFTDGALDCSISESPIAGYAPGYECFSEGTCEATESACSFTAVSAGEQNLCTIRNQPDPVAVTVTKQWIQTREGLEVDRVADIELHCTGLLDGDGEWVQNEMHWRWDFDGDVASHTASVVPRFDGSTRCRTEETLYSSAVEAVSSCENGIPIPAGAGSVNCTVSNAVFFEGIPTLDRFGLMLAAVLLLATGLIAVRRF